MLHDCFFARDRAVGVPALCNSLFKYGQAGIWTLIFKLDKPDFISIECCTHFGLV